MSKLRLTDLLPLNLPLPPELEQWRLRLLRELPGPVTGEQTLFVGEPLKAIVVFAQEGVEVLLPVQAMVMGSHADHKPRSQGRVQLNDGDYDRLYQLVLDTIRQRMLTFRECACCGRRTPQEQLGSLNGQPACRRCLEGRRFLF